MWKKRLMSILLSAVLAVSCLGTAFAAEAPFPDITDPQTVLEADVLRMLGAVEGSGGKFDPSGSLTRAQFCKMAVIVMGNGELANTYRNRTIFPDVRASHWARGYVNLASAGETCLIKGNPDGTFRPDSVITYGQAVTILMRVLGYTDADTGLIWPEGYLELAARVGLTEGLDLQKGASITRAQAAHLFCNLLNTPTRQDGAYCESLGTVVPDAVILALDVTAEDGTAGAVRTSDGVKKVQSGVAPQSLLGQKGSLILNGKGEIITLVPDGGESRTITVSAAAAGRLTDSGGSRYTIPAGTTAYTSEGRDTYDRVWLDIAPGDRVTLYFTAGKVSALYVNTAAASSAVVVTGTATAATFRALTGGAVNYPIYRNGQAITYADIQPYDVATYAAGALTVSGLRVTGAYENVTPNTEYPASVTVMGHVFPVLPDAVDTLSAFKLGETITLLLTADGQVAAAYRPSVVQGNALGIVEEADGDNAKVKLLGSSIVLSGKPSYSGGGTSPVGELVQVSSYQKGTLQLSKLPSSGGSYAYNAAARKLGGYPLAAGAVIGERVGTGAVRTMDLSELTQTTVPAAQISYYHLNASGQVDVLIFDNVTGDCYTYGILSSRLEEVYDSGFSWTERVMTVTNAGGENGPYRGGGSVTGGMKVFGGIAVGGSGRVADYVILTAVQKVSRSDFTTIDGVVWYVKDGQSFPVWEGVQCYNAVTGTWFSDLAACRAFSNDLTVYYDRPVSEGGKVRVVVAN